MVIPLRLKKTKDNQEKLSTEVRTIISQSDLPTKLSTLLRSEEQNSSQRPFAPIVKKRFNHLSSPTHIVIISPHTLS